MPLRVLANKEEWQDQERTLRKSYRFGTDETRGRSIWTKK
jgi:hypothetical protein